MYHNADILTDYYNAVSYQITTTLHVATKSSISQLGLPANKATFVPYL